MKDSKNQMKEENKQYLLEHPELTGLLDDFVAAVIREKPTDIIKFGYSYFDTMRVIDSGSGPQPLVIAGPSGVGKGTMIKRLMETYPDAFGFSVSHTTRAPRPGEENGVHYHFVPKPEMEEAVKRGEFLEHAYVHTNMYGTSIKAVASVRSQNRICILDIDCQGVRNVKEKALECKLLFIAPPSMETLVERLTGRGTETAEKIAIRVHNATAELEYGYGEGNFDALIVNDDLETAYMQIKNQLREWYPEIRIGGDTPPPESFRSGEAK